MEAAPKGWNGQSFDLRHTSGCEGMSIPGASAVGLGSGKSNTEAIVSACPESYSAAKIADDLVLNGKSDWFLPSRDELNEMYLHRAGIGFQSSENGMVYSSSSFSADLVWAQVFTDYPAFKREGSQIPIRRNSMILRYIRPIRYVEFVDPFPTKPVGRSPIWRNPEQELPTWELAIMRSVESSTTPDTYLTVFFPSGDAFGSHPSRTVSINVSFSHDVPGGSSPVYQGLTCIGSVERCTTSAGLPIVSVSSDRYGTRFMGTDGDRFLNDFPKNNLDNGIPVVFWVRFVGGSSHTFISKDSGWIKVDLRSWPYQRT